MKPERRENLNDYFQSIKGSLLYHFATEGLHHHSQEAEKPPEGPAEQNASSSAIKIPPDSVLFMLWEEWQAAGAPPSALTLDEFFDDKSPLLPSPLTHEETELEKLRLKMALQKVSQKRKKALAKADADGQVPWLDAEPVLLISKNRLAAWLFVFAPVSAGADLLWEQVEDLLRTSGIVYGIREDLLRRAVDERLYFVPLRIASGQRAVPEEDGKLVPRLSPGAVIYPTADDDAQVDYKAISHFQIVRKDEVICRILFPSGGVAGIEITGKEIPFAKGKPVAPPCGTNTALNREQDEVIALREGHLVLQNGKYHVRSALVVPEHVDYSTGNIDFVGDVQVKGDVKSGFRVRATGSITIGGIIEGGAYVEAGGNIVVAKGILGDGNSIVKSRRSIKAHHLQNCTVYAEELVEANSIIASQVVSNNQIRVLSGHGTIIGGSMIALHQIEAKIIGSEALSTTKLLLGPSPEKQAEVDKVKKDLEGIIASLEEIEQSLAAPNDGAPIEAKLAQCRLKSAALTIRKGVTEKKLEELSASLTGDPSTRRVICGTLHPGTTIEIHGVVLTVQQTNHGCRVRLSEDGSAILLR